MNKVLVVVFDTESQVYQARDVLRDLHAKGDINLYANAVVSRDTSGQLQVEQTTDERPIGLLSGSLIGLLPRTRTMAVSAGVDTLTAEPIDTDAHNITPTFEYHLDRRLTNCKTALVAEIDEGLAVPLDTQMEAVGGIVIRRLMYEVEEDRFEKEFSAIVSSCWLLATLDCIIRPHEPVVL